jgi:hypothetical protein
MRNPYLKKGVRRKKLLESRKEGMDYQMYGWDEKGMFDIYLSIQTVSGHLNRTYRI